MATMAECDRLYKRYSDLKQDKYNNNDIHTAYESYQSARNKLNTREFLIQQKLYKEILQSSDGNSYGNWLGKHRGGKEMNGLGKHRERDELVRQTQGRR